MIIGKSNELDSPNSDYLAMIYSSVLILKYKKKLMFRSLNLRGFLINLFANNQHTFKLNRH